jgi:phosphoserine phosphatase RsbU/P
MKDGRNAKTKLLLVDDLEENLLALEALLRRPELELLKAHSGTEALELLLTHDVALALVDVQMPELDGFELAELMRGSERTRTVPIIFVTAGAREANRIFQGYDAGAVDFLFKPVDPHILRHKVDTFVELHRQRQQLAAQVEVIRASEEFRRRIIESSQDLIAVLDVQGAVLSLNAKGKEVFGSEPLADRLLWTSLWESDEAERCLARARGGEVARFQARGMLAEFRDHTWDVAVTPMRDARGRVERLLAVARDVTELQRLNEELTATLRLNETFVAAVGHDLRTPLNSIVLSTELLMKAATQEREAAADVRVIERLRTSARRMSKMIDELFDLARARLSGGIPISPVDGVDLFPVAEKIVSELAATEPGRTLELRRSGDTRGSWDVDRLGQVLANLLGNALRHGSSEGAVELALDGSHPFELVLTVSNRGQIPDEIISCLFEPFRRGNARVGSVEGLGLGLFIVQQIVQAHAGDIEARSQDGITTFRMVLPRKPESIAPQPAL